MDLHFVYSTVNRLWLDHVNYTDPGLSREHLDM